MYLNSKEEMTHKPFLWSFFENKQYAYSYKYSYNNDVDLNIVEINGKQIPYIIFDDVFRRTHTVTEAKKERIDEDPS